MFGYIWWLWNTGFSMGVEKKTPFFIKLGLHSLLLVKVLFNLDSWRKQIQLDHPDASMLQFWRFHVGDLPDVSSLRMYSLVGILKDTPAIILYSNCNIGRGMWFCNMKINMRWKLETGNKLSSYPTFYGKEIDPKQNSVPGHAINSSAKHVKPTCLDFTRVLPRLVNVSLFFAVFFCKCSL